MRAKPEVGSVGGAVPVPACELLGRTLGEFVVREKLGAINRTTDMIVERLDNGEIYIKK